MGGVYGQFLPNVKNSDFNDLYENDIGFTKNAKLKYCGALDQGDPRMIEE